MIMNYFYMSLNDILTQIPVAPSNERKPFFISIDNERHLILHYDTMGDLNNSKIGVVEIN